MKVYVKLSGIMIVDLVEYDPKRSDYIELEVETYPSDIMGRYYFLNDKNEITIDESIKFREELVARVSMEIGVTLSDSSYDHLSLLKIRSKYNLPKESSIIRQKDTNPEEFAEYYFYCEQCKLDAKKELGIIDEVEYHKSSSEIVEYVSNKDKAQDALITDLQKQLLLLTRMTINHTNLSDDDSLKMKSLYPQWKEGEKYIPPFKVQYNGRLFKIRQEVMSLSHQPPGSEGMAAIYTEINETNSGTITDPILYNSATGMLLEVGKYYVEDGIIYICTREIQAVHPLSALVEHYVELA